MAATPQNVTNLIKKGFKQVLVEKNAGAQAQFLDEQYKAAGATLVDKQQVFSASDILLKVRPPASQETALVKEGGTVISFLYPNQNKEIVDGLAARKANAFAMEMIPRISRAQVFDALRCVPGDADWVAWCSSNMQLDGEYRWVQGGLGSCKSLWTLFDWSGNSCGVRPSQRVGLRSVSHMLVSYRKVCSPLVP